MGQGLEVEVGGVVGVLERQGRLAERRLGREARVALGQREVARVAVQVAQREGTVEVGEAALRAAAGVVEEGEGVVPEVAVVALTLLGVTVRMAFPEPVVGEGREAAKPAPRAQAV